jgi:hypothetical protein
MLAALNAGMLAALNARRRHAGRLAALNAGMLAALNAGMQTALNAGMLAALNAGMLAALNAGMLAALNAGMQTELGSRCTALQLYRDGAREQCLGDKDALQRVVRLVRVRTGRADRAHRPVGGVIDPDVEHPLATDPEAGHASADHLALVEPGRHGDLFAVEPGPRPGQGQLKLFDHVSDGTDPGAVALRDAGQVTAPADA